MNPVSPLHRTPSSLPLLVASVLAVLITNVAGDVLTACYDGSNKTIDIHCGRGSLVRILKTFYGYSRHGDCSYRPEDCTRQEQEGVDCVGRSWCSLPLRWVEEGGVMLPQCQKRSNYFQVEYECVPKTELQDICSSSQLKAQRGHIVTPSYPLPFSRRLACSLTIVVAPSQKLRLNIISMELRAQGKTDCADWLYFNDKFHSLTLCGRRSNIWYDMHSNFLHIELQSANHSTSQGFWLYYEADPLLPTTPPTPPLLEETTVREEDRKDEGGGGGGGGGSILLTTLLPKQPPPQAPRHTTPIPVYRDKHNSSKPRGAKSLPFAAIAGGVIGTLSLVLIVLLMLLLIKWLKERQYFKDEKFLEIRNPAFRSSGDFHDANTATYNY
ncbi:uncharacterized protein LOC143282989 [Babylonia areolata]|uniref:uncharacterized protein LOC143282989 n=1 Tax=Babylonia areolata TaxID=304850 RepID=UPI003FD3B0E2